MFNLSPRRSFKRFKPILHFDLIRLSCADKISGVYIDKCGHCIMVNNTNLLDCCDSVNTWYFDVIRTVC